MDTVSTEMDATKARDWKIISLIGIIHACSHFFQLVLPTLFLYLNAEFGFDYVQLGFVVTCFFLVSVCGQASSGFLVDRIGPAPVLFFGLGAFVVSALLLAAATSYSMLILAAIMGGAGNSIFHPVDYSIINHRVTPDRLGYAFSVHGLTGNLGWAIAPLFITTLSMAYGWRTAVYGVAIIILAVLVMAIWYRSLWGGVPQQQSNASQANVIGSSSALTTLAILLKKPTLWGAFLFFAFNTMATSAIQNYTIPLLSSVYGLSEMMAGSGLSAYMVTAAVGMVAGGFVAGATAKSERIVFISLCMAGAFMLLLALNIVPSYLAIVLVAAAGFCSGIAAPSRDMLIRRVTPKGATGTVYGLVYSGMDVGSSIGPILFGYMVDAQFERGPWLGAAVAFVISAGLAVSVAYAANRSEQVYATTSSSQ